MNAVRTLINTIAIKFIDEFFNVSRSFVAIENPNPKIGPIRGEISIAPMTTAVESAFNPTEAIKIEHTRIHEVVPIMEISFFIEFTTRFLSTSFLKLNTFFVKRNNALNKPDAFFLISSELSLKSNFVSTTLFL